MHIWMTSYMYIFMTSNMYIDDVIQKNQLVLNLMKHANPKFGTEIQK